MDQFYNCLVNYAIEDLFNGKINNDRFLLLFEREGKPFDQKLVNKACDEAYDCLRICGIII